MKLTQTLEPHQRLPNLILFHANRALLRSGVVAETILFCCVERDHSHGEGWWSLGCWVGCVRVCVGGGLGSYARGVVLDAVADVRFAGLFVAVFG